MLLIYAQLIYTERQRQMPHVQIRHFATFSQKGDALPPTLSRRRALSFDTQISAALRAHKSAQGRRDRATLGH